MLAKRIGLLAASAGLLVSAGVMIYSYPYPPSKYDLIVVMYASVATSLVSLICILCMKVIEPADGKENLLSLWIKRKRLEERSKIEQLERKS